MRPYALVALAGCQFALPGLPNDHDVPPLPPTPPLQDADATPPMLDPNGVRQIYPTRLDRAPPWTLGFADWQSRTRGFGTAEGEQAATIVTASGQVRMNVAAEDTPCTGDPDQGAALARGFMCSQNDWYAVEITAYVQLVASATADDDRDWVWYAGGGRHTGDGAPDGCTGSAYKGAYHYATGEVRVRKENFHVNYFNRDWKPVADGIDFTVHTDQWLGMKLVRYEVVRDGVRGMRLEQYLDLAGIDPATDQPANAWTLVNVEEDVGGWSSGATACGAPTSDQPMLWGGPWATFRWDATTSRTRLMSVREIVPPETPLDAPASAR